MYQREQLRAQLSCPRIVISDVMTPLMQQAGAVVARRRCSPLVEGHSTDSVVYLPGLQRAYILPDGHLDGICIETDRRRKLAHGSRAHVKPITPELKTQKRRN